MKIEIFKHVNVFAWENQSKQYPQNGDRIQYYKGIYNKNKWIDCLLFYGEHHLLEGILNHYPFDFPPHEKQGNINIQVRPDRRRLGIATTLLDEARLKFKINLDNQNYTPEGRKFIKGYLTNIDHEKMESIYSDRTINS
jgi:hypothetical protein